MTFEDKADKVKMLLDILIAKNLVHEIKHYKEEKQNG